MPKKTKRQKILAEARRIINQTKSTADISPDPSQYSTRIHNPEMTYSVPTAAPRLPVAPVVSPVTDFKAVQTGIIKTITLAIVAVLIELILYWRINGPGL
ncbi:hypothetical protein A2154_05210 [Candidatus Gottesmanbacteria bacterium RBG_16_43_7]|uniref:Uncharacterized protein n=1 Tax=Candidatus Gottesmanbacteria bacterium RBG_16_43_7 TaxID=1798373 RepID=A0A1F5Z922_9BACT|nr:MAG: hypothetical protein A2154_05210 [Candidatus Gottesmanbacteria bacterium RBG_16_43_7]